MAGGDFSRTRATPVRWGILGTASIARRQAAPAIRSLSGAALAAVASRSPERAARFAAEFDIPVACGSYDELLLRNDVDAVYIPLPNHLHLPWIERAVRAGKHVLCEKPLGLGAGEVERVLDLARESGRMVMEGVASRFHPVHRRVEALLEEGAVGELRLIRVSLGWSLTGKPDDYRWRPEMGGGALLDLGCYGVDAARRFAGAEPEWVSARAVLHPETGVDTGVAALFAFPESVTALVECGIDSAARNAYEVIGTKGRIVVESPFGNRVESRPLTLLDVQGNVVRREEEAAPQVLLQFEAVSRAIADRRPAPFPLAESLANARILDACLASARAGGVPVRP